MTFTEEELAFLRRFCWELCYIIGAPLPTEEQCPGHFSELRDLAHASGVAPEVLANYNRGELTDLAPPEVPFPWQSLDHMIERAKEVRAEQV